MPKCFKTPVNKYYLRFLNHDVQSLVFFLKIALFLSFIYTCHLMMSTRSDINPINTVKDISEDCDEEKNKTSEQKDKKENAFKSVFVKKPREADKHKNTTLVSNRSTYQRKYFRPPILPKRKSATAVSIRMSNPSAEIVLQERQVEIKDLESQVAYLQSQIKDLKAENRTLLEVQNRQTKELKKYCGGVTDIPALIRSHNDEIKAIQSNASVVRKELRVCQSDLKSKSDGLLKKDLELNKFKHTLKNREQNVQEMTVANRKLKLENKKLENETKNLLNENEELKSKTQKIQKTIQQLTNKVLDLEELLSTTEHCKNQIQEKLKELQSKYDETLKNEITLKNSLEAPKVMSATQTEKLEMVHASCMTLEISVEPELMSSEKGSIGIHVSQDQIDPIQNSTELKETEMLGNFDEKECHSTASKDKFTALDVYPDIFYRNEFTNKPPTHVCRPAIVKTMHSTSSLSREISKETSEVKETDSDSVPSPVYELSKRPLGLVYDKRSTPLSSNLQVNSKIFPAKDSLNKPNALSGYSLNPSLKMRKNTEDDLNFYFKDYASMTLHRKSSSRIESLGSNAIAKKDIQNDIRTKLLNPTSETSLTPYNRNDLFLNVISKQNTMFLNS